MIFISGDKNKARDIVFKVYLMKADEKLHRNDKGPLQYKYFT